LNVIIELSRRNEEEEETIFCEWEWGREMKISVERDIGEKIGYEDWEWMRPKIWRNTEEERKRNLRLLYLYYERGELTVWVWNVNFNGKCFWRNLGFVILFVITYSEWAETMVECVEDIRDPRVWVDAMGKITRLRFGIILCYDWWLGYGWVACHLLIDGWNIIGGIFIIIIEYFLQQYGMIIRKIKWIIFMIIYSKIGYVFMYV